MNAITAAPLLIFATIRQAKKNRPEAALSRRASLLDGGQSRYQRTVRGRLRGLLRQCPLGLLSAFSLCRFGVNMEHAREIYRTPHKCFQKPVLWIRHHLSVIFNLILQSLNIGMTPGQPCGMYKIGVVPRCRCAGGNYCFPKRPV